MNNPFNEQYYSSVNYTDYADRSSRYARTAHNLIVALEAFSIIHKDTTSMLDFGCAVGFLIEGFGKYGYSVNGYDISEWAVKQARDKGLEIVDSLSSYDVMFALDVFEHMKDIAIAEALGKVVPKHLIVRIPCAENGTDFYLAVSKRDPTHINCKNKEVWEDFFSHLGYKHSFSLNLDTIYDSPGVLCALFTR